MLGPVLFCYCIAHISVALLMSYIASLNLVWCQVVHPETASSGKNLENLVRFSVFWGGKNFHHCIDAVHVCALRKNFGYRIDAIHACARHH